MINILHLIIIVLTHSIGDFVLQTSWQAENKYKDHNALNAHVIRYTLCWLIPMFCIFYTTGYNFIGAIIMAIFFCIVTYILHYITDFFTSKINHNLLVKNDYHTFFIMIQVDQLLHYTQLILTYKKILIED